MANAVTAFLDDRLAARQGDRSAIVTPSATTTYGELLTAVNRTGNALRALGVAPEQRVALLLPDGVEWVAAFFGALRIGAVAVPLNTRLTPADLVAPLRDSRAKVLVGDAGLVGPLRPALAELPWLKVIEPEDLLRGGAPALDPEPMSDDDMAFWLYTSGTTGAAKAAVHLHRDLLACRHYGLHVLRATAGDRVFATSKLFFAYALGNGLLIPLYVGGQTFLHPAWPDPAIVAEAMTRFRPTLFFSVPTFYARLLRSDLPRATFASLRCAVSAGERLPEEVYRAVRERFGLEILEGMGATETIFMVLSNRPGESRAGSSGTPVPGTEARLLDGDGREVAEGAEGVLHVKTPSASPFYWNRAEQSRRAFVGEWFRTGDVYARDAEGFYHHRGREDDLFKVAGMWVGPGDVEAALLAHPDVAEAGVVGAEDESGLTKPFAFVVPKAGADAAFAGALARLAEEKLAPHQRPRRIFVVPELPRTATGKLQRFLLRARVR
jgi:benzoate-CoA ligase family protein